jgi:hypothetical protein
MTGDKLTFTRMVWETWLTAALMMGSPPTDPAYCPKWCSTSYGIVSDLRLKRGKDKHHGITNNLLARLFSAVVAGLEMEVSWDVARRKDPGRTLTASAGALPVWVPEWSAEPIGLDMDFEPGLGEVTPAIFE